MIAMELSAPLADIVRAAATLAANLLVQSTVIVAAGLLAARLLERHGAAVQSSVLRATLGAVLACPAVSWALAISGVSGFGVALPSPASLADASSERIVDTVAPMRDAAPDQRVSFDQETPHMAAFDNDLIIHEAPRESPTVATIPVAAAPSTDAPAEHVRATASSPLVWFYVSIAAVWTLGAAALILRIAVGNFLLLRHCAECTGPTARAVADCRSVCRAMGVSPPRLRVSAKLNSPCLVGLFRPAILLPRSMTSVSEDVFVHELAHLRRRDCHWQLLGCLTTAAIWFQPLVWRLSRRLRQTADDVADDFVVQHGGDRAEYARRLVDIAENCHAQWQAACAGAGMVSFRSSLAKRVARIMDTSRPLSTRTELAALAAIILISVTGVMATGLLGVAHAAGQDGEPGSVEQPVINGASEKPSREASRKDEPTDADGPAANQPAPAGAQRRLQGVVLHPSGKPHAGASVFVGLGDFSGDDGGLRVANPVEAKSDADGRFDISYRPRELFENPQAVPDVVWDRVDGAVYLAAAAAGFGPDWVRGPEPSRSQTLRLVDDTPIEGQLLTLEGVGAANARVRLESVQAAPDNNIAPWLDSLRNGVSMWKASVDHKHQNITPNVFHLPRQYLTDEQGRFRITGIGRNRVARLVVEGPAVARTIFRAAARPMAPLPTNLSSPLMDGGKLYGAKFQRIVSPSQPITGVVKDAETGRPLPNVAIESYRFAGSNVIGSRNNVLRTRTDQAGRFRLESMPKGRGNRLLAVPGDDQPYFMREIPIPETAGLDAIEVDVTMHRGLWITGKVLDKATGEPVRATLHYLPFLSNEHVQKLPEFTTLGNGLIDGAMGHQHRYVTRQDGSFRLVGAPGKAIVGAETISKHRQGAGAEKIQGMEADGRFATYNNPIRASKTWPSVMAEINPGAGAESVSIVLEADPGGAIQVHVTDEQGKPATGYRVSGQSKSSVWSETIDRPSFVAGGISPGESRILLIHHGERNIGKAIRVTDENREITVALAPCATIRGRLIDGEGAPLARATLRAYTQPSEDFNPSLRPIESDPQGRFEFDAVLPGCEYRVQVRTASRQIRTNVMKFAPKAGETVSLGDVKAQ